jgi:hypothetical protein
LWLFKNGYWQETIPSFSIDLLRDVKTVYDEDTIIFVNSDLVESSVDATTDFPFILASGATANISYTPYGLPFYTGLGIYDEIDIIKYKPEINSVLYWDGENWFPFLREYSTQDIIGYNTENAVTDDIMVWNNGEFTPTNKELYIQYRNSYEPKYLTQLASPEWQERSGWDTWYDYVFNIVEVTNDPNMVDTVNDRIKCTSAGIYRVVFQWITRLREPYEQYHTLSLSHSMRHFDSIGIKKNEWNMDTTYVQIIYYYEYPQYKYNHMSIEVPCAVGDYFDMRFMRKKQWRTTATPFNTKHAARISLFKIGSVV